MDFFDRQEKARRRTKWLILYFLVAVALIVAAVYLVVAAVFLRSRFQAESLMWLWNSQVFVGAAGGTLLVILGGTSFKLLELRSGGSAVAQSLGGTPVNPNTTDPDERKLLNVVEEMAIASGTPVPEVYLLPNERGINAFAAGHATTDAAIGVTRGGMQLLNRDELQGVIAHEFSHILNGDMRLNLRLMGLVHGILCLAIIGRILIELPFGSSNGRSRRGRDGEGLHWGLLVLGVALLAIGSVGVFFGRLIKSAVSRQRECLADAAAVQFTRNPEGLAGALKKIGGLASGSRVHSPVAEEASHLFFGNALKDSWLNQFSTHPPLVERIRALDPQFDGVFPKVEPLPPVERAAEVVPVRWASQQTTARALSELLRAAPRATPGVRVEGLAPHLGTLGPEHVRHAATLLAAIPERLAEAAREPLGAVALVYGLLLSQDEATREAQLAAVAQAAGTAVLAATQGLLAETAAVPVALRLALVDLALPALRRLSPSQYEQFTQLLQTLVEADQQIDLFEYALQKLVRRHLEPHFHPVRKSIIQYYALTPLLDDCLVLLSTMAYVGHDRPKARRAAFEAGARRLGLIEPYPTPLSLEQCNLAQVDTALEHLGQATPALRRIVVEGCGHTIAADGLIQEKEFELLRAVADALDCPIPPYVQAPRG